MVHHKIGEGKSLSGIRPRYYTTRNTYDATGMPWRYIRDKSVELGVTIHKPSPRQWFVDADEFDEKLRALTAALPAANDQQPDQQDPTAIVLAQLGLEVRK